MSTGLRPDSTTQLVRLCFQIFRIGIIVLTFEQDGLWTDSNHQLCVRAAPPAGIDRRRGFALLECVHDPFPLHPWLTFGCLWPIDTYLSMVNNGTKEAVEHEDVPAEKSSESDVD